MSRGNRSSVPMTVYLTKQEAKDLEKHAKKLKMPKSNILRYAMARYFDTISQNEDKGRIKS